MRTTGEHPAITHARRVAKARPGPAFEEDRPVRRSQPPRVIPEQLSIEDALRERAGDAAESGRKDSR
jgi:hypothetical protein